MLDRTSAWNVRGLTFCPSRTPQHMLSPSRKFAYAQTDNTEPATEQSSTAPSPYKSNPTVWSPPQFPICHLTTAQALALTHFKFVTVYSWSVSHYEVCRHHLHSLHLRPGALCRGGQRKEMPMLLLQQGCILPPCHSRQACLWQAAQVIQLHCGDQLPSWRTHRCCVLWCAGEGGSRLSMQVPRQWKGQANCEDWVHEEEGAVCRQDMWKPKESSQVAVLW